MVIDPQLGYDDGLPMAEEIGSWAEVKYRLVRLYSSLFATGMKGKWDERIYLDLYAGSGFSRVRNTGRILLGSPLLALTVDHPFDRYIFCEKNPQFMSALQARAKRVAPEANISFVPGDCNTQAGQILSLFPRGSKEHTVLGLCFADPFNLGLNFETIRKLSADRLLDFLCLLAVYMDANRNYVRYLKEESHKVDQFLGSNKWRSKWAKLQTASVPFPKFLAQEFGAQMQTIRYIPPPLYAMKEIRSDEKNLPLYYLALFSRSPRAYEFWDQVLKYSTDQISMF